MFRATFSHPIIHNRRLTRRLRIGLRARNVLTARKRARDVAGQGRLFLGAKKADFEVIMQQSEKVSLLNAAMVGAGKLLLIVFALFGVIDYSAVGPLIGIEPAQVPAFMVGAC